ncbi:hypothetical protein [Arenimonas terrae]|jgi:hypothetical protein|uniref:Uncharacterized protein n=1 Tax=Arenimonas terrae TaxID=2546226 RepID=A0A5C4RYN3_9GAMM|nr:hypothetical protein [Arenimonas terrae]TNJ35787.1 hypothetical protein E1B00_08595 [Arenimonas terrae]
MPRVIIHISLDGGDESRALSKFNQDWALVEDWIERWRERMDVCPDHPEGCFCCHAYWEVDAPTEALEELPGHMLQAGTW